MAIGLALIEANGWANGAPVFVAIDEDEGLVGKGVDLLADISSKFPGDPVDTPIIACHFI